MLLNITSLEPGFCMSTLDRGKWGIASALVLGLGLASCPSALAQNAERPEFKCPRGDLRPLGRAYDAKGTLIDTPMGILAPLAIFGAFFDFIFSDDLAKQPKTKVSFVVKGADGKSIKDGVLALYHDGWRYLANLPLDGKVVDLPIGEYTIMAITKGQKLGWGRHEVELKVGKPARIEMKADQTFADAAPSALAHPAPAGSVMALDLLNGLMKRSTIAVFRDEKMLWQQQVGASPGRIIAPPEAGHYTMRVVSCAPQVAVASWPFEVSAPNIALIAPQKVAAGSSFELRWRGDGAEGDLIGYRAKGQSTILLGEVTYSGSREKLFKFVAPFDAGEYEIVYRSSLGPTILATHSLTVTPSDLVIKAPQTIAAGEKAEFHWPSGAGVKSELTLWPFDNDPYKPTTTLANPGANRLLVPPGRYRLALKDGDKTRWSQAISVTPSRMLDTIPSDVAPGAMLTIADDKNLAFFDQFAIVPAGTRDLDAHVLERGNEFRGKAELLAPALPGRYEIVYLAADHANDKRDIARKPLIVPSPDGQDLAITAPKELGVLDETLLSWPEPDGHSLEIWHKEANRPAKLARKVEHAGKLHLGLLPGSYEVRLVKNAEDDQPKPVLHRRALTVRATKILHDVPAEVQRGKALRFRREGKPGFFDRIVIARAGPKAPREDYIGIGVDASENEIDAPDKPGRYELVYLSRNSDRKDTAIERVPFTVK